MFGFPIPNDSHEFLVYLLDNFHSKGTFKTSKKMVKMDSPIFLIIFSIIQGKTKSQLFVQNIQGKQGKQGKQRHLVRHPPHTALGIPPSIRHPAIIKPSQKGRYQHKLWSGYAPRIQSNESAFFGSTALKIGLFYFT